MSERPVGALTPKDKRNMTRIEASLETAMEHIQKLNQTARQPSGKRQTISPGTALTRGKRLTRAAVASLRRIQGRIDQELVTQNVRLARKLCGLLSQSYPRLDRKAVGSISSSMSDIFAVGVKYIRALGKILVIADKSPGRRLEVELIRIEVLLLEELEDDLGNLRRGLPGLWRHLEAGGVPRRDGKRRSLRTDSK